MLNPISTDITSTAANYGLVAETRQTRKQNKFNSELANTAMHKALQIATVACAIISVVPALRLAGSLALRAVAFLSTLLSSTEKLNNDLMGTVMKCLKLAIIAFGLVAIAAASPALIVAALAVDISLHIFDASKAFYNGNIEKGLIHLGIGVINTFALAAVAAGSWQVMVTAAALSSVFMGLMAIKTTLEIADGKRSAWDFIDVLCHLALMGTGAVAAIKTAEITARSITKTNYQFRNYGKEGSFLFNNQNRLVGYAAPGETKIISLDGRTGNLVTGFNQIVRPHHYNYATHIVQPAMPVSSFPTVPVGGLSIALDEATPGAA